MQQQSRCKQSRHNPGPIHFVIKRIQFSAVVERAENERHETKDVKMDRARRIPSLPQNKKSDEEIKQSGKPQIVFDGSWLMGRSRYAGGVKFLAVARELVPHLVPQACSPQSICDL